MANSNSNAPQIPAASFPLVPPLGHIPFVDLRTGHLSQPAYQQLTQWWAGLQNEGGIKPQADGNSSSIAVIFNMSGDGTISSTGVLTIVSSEGRVFVESAFALPTLTLTMPAQFQVSGSPWEQAGTIAVVTASPLTVSTLPASPSDGDRNFVSDSNVVAAANFGEAVVGGGTNHVPVYYDAGTTTWRIG